MNGFLNIIKPTGLTASDIVVKIRRITGGKVGHLGTLDPGAAGVLPIALGRATRLFDYLTVKTKQYRAKFTFGVTTDTLDSYGVITETMDFILKQQQVQQAASKLTGTIMQVPPIYSAINVKGKRSYDLARKGVDVELKARAVTVEKFDLLDIEGDTCTFDIVCGGGTYIRSLARDLATYLDTVAYMSALIRMSSGIFDYRTATTLDEINADNIADVLLPIDFPLKDMPRIVLSNVDSNKMLNGIRLRSDNKDGIYCVYDQNGVVGIVQCKDKVLYTKTFLNT